MAAKLLDAKSLRSKFIKYAIQKASKVLDIAFGIPMSLGLIFICSLSVIAFLTSYFLLVLRLCLTRLVLCKAQVCSDSTEREEGKISILMTTLNDACYVGKTLRNLEATTKDKSRVEIIIIDGGSTDNTLDLARASTCVIRVKYIKLSINDAKRLNKSEQLKLGYQFSDGAILLLLAPDVMVPFHYDDILRQEMRKDPQLIMATFKLGLDKIFNTSIVTAVGFRIAEMLTNFMSTYCHLPTPKQGIAIRSSSFCTRYCRRGNQSLDGADEVRDFIVQLCIQSLLGGGRIKTTPGACISVTSQQRWTQDGVWRSLIRDNLRQAARVFMPRIRH